MMKPISSIAPTVLLAAVVTAQVLKEANHTIVGCIDVGCPSATDTTSDNCTVVDRSFPVIGITRIPTDSEALAGLSWTKGFQISRGWMFNSTYYLSTPPGLDLSNNSTGACAIFFHGVSEGLSFYGTSDELGEGTCSQALGSACVDALTARARKFDIIGYYDKASSPQERCEKLREDLETNMDDACRQVSSGSWKNLTAVAIAGDGAPEPITGQQNASSTCWPTTAKNNDLTLVENYGYRGRAAILDMADAMYAITPILTLFYPNGEGSLINASDASLSCIKVMGPALASVPTMVIAGAADLSASSFGLSALAMLLTASLQLVDL